MYVTNVIKDFRKELPAFHEMTRRFYDGEISAKEYKGFSGRYGSYAQRGGKASMLRLRLSGGCIDKDQLKFIADSIEKYGIDRIHVTTCQTIQLHNLKANTVFELIEQAMEHGIITWGGGGDFPRNVMMSPLAGVERGEAFDVLPYARRTADYLLSFMNEAKMPRKLKVGFSNSPANVTHVTFRDMGFAAKEDGTFDVYSAGGLGSNPKMGLCVARGVEPTKILYYIKAMIELFREYGNYENRAKARTRYMQEVLGEEGYVAAFLEKLAQMLDSDEDLNIDPVHEPVTKAGDGSVADGRRIIAQKQEGLYAVEYHPIGGTPKPEMMRMIYETIKDMEAVTLRLSPEEGIYIINCTGEEAAKVMEVTADGAENMFEASVACIGAKICQHGVGDSQKLMHELIDVTRKHGFEDGVLPKIHISGCPSSCGTHQIGVIGFHGGIKLIDKVANPAFTLHIAGCALEGRERFGEKTGVILAKDIPAFLVAIGNAVSADHMLFEVWFPRNVDRLKEIAQKYLQ